MNEHDWFTVRYGIRLPGGKMATTIHGQVWMWDTVEEAERAVGYFRTYAERQLGINDWTGEIVRQLCTPWISPDDNADLMVKELSAWLERQTGGSQ